jgi:hypothetical protein
MATKRQRTPRVSLPIPFRMGDVVVEIGPPDFGFCNLDGSNSKYQRESLARWEKERKGRKHIIQDTKLRNEGYFEYATDHGAWYAHSRLQLLEKSSAKTLNRLLGKQRASEDEDYEE